MIPETSSRPARLPGHILVGVVALSAASFVTGILVWRGKYLQDHAGVTPDWFRQALVFHGWLNPFLCALFGYLVCQHIRSGWQLRANRVTGLVLEGVFAGLILTGAGLYYAGSPEGRAVCETGHRVLGVCFPVLVAVHWVRGRRWAAEREAAEAQAGGG